MDENFDALLDLKENVTRRIRASLEGKLMTALLIGCILVSAFFSIVDLGVINPFDPTVWIRLGTQLVTSYLVFLMFIDPGERAEVMRVGEHKSIRDRLSTLSEEISRNGLMARFHAFCRHKEERGTEERRRQIYGRYMDDSTFSALSGVPVKDLRRRFRAGEITRGQYMAVRRASVASVRTLRPELILSSDPATPPEEIGKRITYRQRKTLQRPIVLVLLNVLTHSMTFLGAEAFSIGMLISVLTSTFSIAVSAFVGYDVGKNSAIWQTTQRQSRIRFILEFEEWNIKKAP